MPRIYAANNDPMDYCLFCFPSEIQANAEHNNGKPEGHGDPNSHYGHDCEHPDYEAEYQGGDPYTCEDCGGSLRSVDNHPQA